VLAAVEHGAVLTARSPIEEIEVNMMSGLKADPYYQSAIDLLGRYPDLSKEELDQLISLYPQLSPVELAMMISNEEIAGKLDAFNRAHPRVGRSPFGHYAVFVGIFVAGLALIGWALLGG
jgi:hypothetical protein